MTRSGPVACLIASCALASCTAVSNIDVCDREGSAEVDVNLDQRGDQLLWSPQAIDALPNGGALLAFETVASMGAPPEVRLASLGADGNVRRTCLSEMETTVEATANIPVVVAPPNAADTGMIATRFGPLGASAVHAWVVDNGGCVTRLGVAPRAFVVRPAVSGEDVKNITAVGAGPNRFALAWLVFDGVGTSMRSRHEAAVIEFYLEAWRFLPSAVGDTYGNLGIPGNQVDRITFARGPGSTIAAAWYDIEPMRGTVRVALLDQALAVITGPLAIGSRGYAGTVSESPSIAMAWDGMQYLVTWIAGDTVDAPRVFGRFLDANGNPLRSELSPDGGAFRLGSLGTGGSETQQSVVAMPGGGFLVAWRESESTGREDASGSGLRAVAFDARGNVRFSNRACNRRDFPLNLSYLGDQRHPILARLTDGTLLTVFESLNGDTADRLGVALRGRAMREWDLFPLEGDRQ